MSFLTIEEDKYLLFSDASEFPSEGLLGFLYVETNNFNKAYFWDALTDNYIYIGTVDIKTITSAGDASETEKGRIQIATQAETNAGTNDTKAITPLKLKNSSLSALDLLNGSGILGAPPAGVWSTTNLGPGLENKIIFIQIVCTVNQLRQVGARSVGGSSEICSLRRENSISFLIKADGASDIQLYTSGAGVLFFHRKTLIN